jgi:hypothetical protein
MKYKSNYIITIVSIFLIIGVVYGIYTLVKISSINIIFISNANNIITLCAFLVFLNYDHFMGMVLGLFSFIFFLIIVLVFWREKLLDYSMFGRLCACIVMIYQVFNDR